MEVICEMMKLKPEFIDEYIKMHKETWPALVRQIRNSGFLEEYIYMLDNLVIVILKCENFKVSSKKLSESEIFKKWTKIVRNMLMTDEGFFHTKELLLDLEPLWNLETFDANGELKK